MLNKNFSGAFKLALAIVFAGLLAGCLPPGPKALVEGQRRLERGELARAVEHLETATRLMSTNAHAWNFLGIAYHQTGQAAKAERAYQSALKVDRNLLEARLNLGNLFLENGRAPEARLEFTAYTLRRPTEGEGFERLAAAELRTRELPSAEAHARKALQLEAENVGALNTLGLVLQQRGRNQEAAQCFAGALRRQPGYAPALLNLAVISHRHLGDRPGALKLYRHYLGLKPRPADADAVAVVARQLELELAPPQAAIPPTPPPPVIAAGANDRPAPVTAKPLVPTATTSAPVVRPAVKPAVQSAPPVQPRVEPPPAPTRMSQPVVVTLPPEPVIRTQPERVARPAAPVVATERVESRSPVAPTPASAGTVATIEPAPARPESRGMLDAINPLRLFRREPKLASRTTPLPATAEVPPEVTVVSTTPPPVSPMPAGGSSTAGARSAAGFSRYEYRSSIPVPAGDRSRAEILLSQGNAAMKTKNLADAVVAFREAAQVDPGWYQAHFNYAAAALEAGRTGDALSAGETAVALRPDSADARYNFALALRRGNYVPDAAAQLEKLLTMDPDEVRAHLTLGNLYAEQLRHKDKAREHYQRVLKLAPRHPQAQAIRYWLVSNPR